VKTAKLRTFLTASMVGAIASFVGHSGAQAADSVLLQYQERERTVTVDDLETFASTGEAVSDDVRAFFDENPEVASFANEVLTTEIFISPQFIERFSDSSLGEFVLIQLNKVLGTTSGNEDLEPLRVAIADSFDDDNRFSVLEIVENYPEDTIRLDFSGLQPVVNDVKAFIEQVEPALQVAREFLQDVVCECETNREVAATDTGSSTASPTPASSTDETTGDEATGDEATETEDESAGSSQSVTHSDAVSTQPCQTN